MIALSAFALRPRLATTSRKANVLRLVRGRARAFQPSWSRTVDLTIRMLFCLAVAHHMLAFAPATLLRLQTVSPVRNVLTVAVIGAGLTLLAAVPTRLNDRAVGYTLTAAAVPINLALPYALNGSPTPQLLQWAQSATTIAVAFLMIAFPFRRALAPVAALIGSATISAALASDLTGDTPAWIDAANALLELTATAALVGSASYIIRDFAAQLDRDIVQATVLRRAEATHRAEGAARAEAERIIHDQVLNALHLASAGESATSWDAARRESSRALALLNVDGPGASSGPYSLDAGLRDLAKSSGLDVRLRLPRHPARLPRDVVDALVNASAEALRNAARHAGIDAATITLRTDAGAATVEISDDGRGFDPTLPSTGFGISQSIHGRLAEVGGTATIDSDVGHGTRVVLRWPLPKDDASDCYRHTLDDAFRAAHRLALGCTVPLLALVVGQALLTSHLLTRPWIGYAAAGAIALTTLAALARARARRFGLGTSILVGLVAAIAPTIAALQLPVGWTPSSILWMATAAGPLVVLVGIYRSLSESIAVSTCCAIAMAAVLMDRIGPANPTGYLDPLLAPFVAFLTVAIARAVVYVARRQITVALVDQHAQHRADAMVQARRTALHHRLSELRADALPLLRDIATSPGPRAELRTRAAAASEGIRDRIRAGAPLDPDARALLHQLRTSGWRLRVRPCAHDSLRWVPGVLDALRDHGPMRVTLSSFPIDEGCEAVGVVDAPTADVTDALRRAADDLGGVLYVDDDTAQLSFVVRDGADRPSEAALT